MPQVVPELVELVEDHQVLAGLAQLPALVEDLLDVRLRTRGLDDLPGDALQPLEPLPGHALGEDRDRLATEQVRVVGAAAAVVAGRRPDRLLGGRVELARHEPRHQAPERGAHLVGTGGEPLADELNDPGRDTRQLGRKLDEVHIAEPAAVRDRLVVPGDPEQVEGVEVPEPDLAQRRLHIGGDEPRVPHLGEGGDGDVALPGPGHGSREGLVVDGEVDHGSSSGSRAFARASSVGGMWMGVVPPAATARIAAATSLSPLPVLRTTTCSPAETSPRSTAATSPA